MKQLQDLSLGMALAEAKGTSLKDRDDEKSAGTGRYIWGAHVPFGCDAPACGCTQGRENIWWFLHRWGVQDSTEWTETMPERSGLLQTLTFCLSWVTAVTWERVSKQGKEHLCILLLIFLTDSINDGHVCVFLNNMYSKLVLMSDDPHDRFVTVITRASLKGNLYPEIFVSESTFPCGIFGTQCRFARSRSVRWSF